MQQIVVGPGQVLDLGYQLRPHPMHAAEHQGESRSGWCAVAQRRAAFCVLFEPRAPRFLCDVAGADCGRSFTRVCVRKPAAAEVRRPTAGTKPEVGADPNLVAVRMTLERVYTHQPG